MFIIFYSLIFVVLRSTIPFSNLLSSSLRTGFVSTLKNMLLVNFKATLLAWVACKCVHYASVRVRTHVRFNSLRSAHKPRIMNMRTCVKKAYTHSFRLARIVIDPPRMCLQRVKKWTVEGTCAWHVAFVCFVRFWHMNVFVMNNCNKHVPIHSSLLAPYSILLQCACSESRNVRLWQLAYFADVSGSFNAIHLGHLEKWKNNH